MIAFYYGMTGFACVWYFRRDLTKSAGTSGWSASRRWSAGSCSRAIFVKSCYDLGKADAGSTTYFGLGSPLVIGIGFLLLGPVLMLHLVRDGPPRVLAAPARGRRPAGARGRRVGARAGAGVAPLSPRRGAVHGRGRDDEVLPRHPGALEEPRAARRRERPRRGRARRAGRARPPRARRPRSRRSRRPPRAAPTRATRRRRWRGRPGRCRSRGRSGSCEPIATTVASSRDERAGEERRAGGRRADDEVGVARRRPASPRGRRGRVLGGAARDERREARAVARDDVHALERRRDRPERADVGPALRAGAEHERRRAPGAARWRTARAETAAVRRFVSAMPSTSAAGRERLGVEEHVDALDPRQPAVGVRRRDRDELDPDRAGRGRRHDQHLAGLARDGLARRVGLGVQAAAQRRLERVDGLRGETPRDGGGVEERDRVHGAHRSTKPVPTGSRGSRTKRCSPVR